MYKGKYTPTDLSLKNIGSMEAKNIRREEMLEDLWASYNAGNYLSEHEKEYIFRNRYQKEQFKNSDLDESYFASLYLIYANDLHGVQTLYKWFDGPLSEHQMEVLKNLK